MCNSKRVMNNKWDSKWRPPPFWIYYFCPFWSIIYFRRQPSTSMQNFIHLRYSAAELLLFVQKSKMAATAILDYNFVMLDHPRNPFVDLKFPFKFRVDLVRTFRNIAIRKFHKFGLKCLFRHPKIMFLGSFDPQTLFFYYRDPKKALLYAETCVLSHKRSWSFSGVTCRRKQK